MSSLNYRYILTVPGILKIIVLIFNILAFTFAQSAENPYYAVKSSIKFESIAIAAFCFTTISLLLSICSLNLQNSTKWLRIELLIQCALIIIYIYGIVSMARETLDCHNVITDGCPRQLTATVAAIAAVVAYLIDGIWKLKELRRKLREERIACSGEAEIAGTDGETVADIE